MSQPVALAALESLLDRALPAERPQFSASVTASGSVEVTLDGDEPAFARVLALALLADALGDDEGPEVIPGRERYTCGEYAGVFFLIRTPVTAEQQAEMTTVALRIAIDDAGTDGLV